MATEVKMPKLGMTMTEGLLTGWQKQEGDLVKKGETLFCIATDKVTADVESPDDGILIQIVQKEGDTVPVGGVVALIGKEGEGAETVTRSAVEPAFENVIRPRDGSGSVRATPAARTAAGRLGIDIETVKGSGPRGRIRRKDVEDRASAGTGPFMASAAAGPPEQTGKLGRETALKRESPEEWEDREPSRIRRISAAKMTESFSSAPHFYLTARADVSKLIEMLAHGRAALEKTSGLRATFTDVLLWVLSRVIPEHPKINAAWTGEKIRLFRQVNIGIAADTGQELVVPVIHRCGRRSFSEITAERSRLVEAARKGGLTPEDMDGGTFTVSNLGMYGIHSFQAILNPPQSALLTVGEISGALAMEDGKIVERSLITMSLSCDHRVMDGAEGARFLKQLKEVMERPEKLLDADLF